MVVHVVTVIFDRPPARDPIVRVFDTEHDAHQEVRAQLADYEPGEVAVGSKPMYLMGLKDFERYKSLCRLDDLVTEAAVWLAVALEKLPEPSSPSVGYELAKGHLADVGGNLGDAQHLLDSLKKEVKNG